MGRRILYGKIGRSMPLTLDKCGTLGGDIEMTAVLTALANRYPDDEIILIGRNSGENPQDVGLPKNVINPWTEWQPELRDWINTRGMNHANLTIAEHQRILAKLMALTGDTFDSADAMVIWVGQHGTSNSPIPKVEDRTVLTKPHDAFTYYSGYLLHGINRWRDPDPWNHEPIFLNADPRNYLKMRDMKWPLVHPVLTQYRFSHRIKHERYDDPNREAFMAAIANETLPYRVREWFGYTNDGDVWNAHVDNMYSRLELNALLPGTPSGDLVTYHGEWDDRKPFGIVINEARVSGVPYARTRYAAMREWVLPLNPAFVFGTWSAESTAKLQAEFPQYNPLGSLSWKHYADAMHGVRCTFTTPSSGSGWATTKPWEAFGLGVVCFFHPEYDTQNHILADAPAGLNAWLRVSKPAELRDKVIYLSTPGGRKDWEQIVNAQYRHFLDNVGVMGRTPQFLRMIDDRLNGKEK